MLRKIALCMALVLLCAAFSGCDGPDKRLFGTWKNEDGTRGYGFGDDGTGYFNVIGSDLPMAYTVKDGQLIVVLGEDADVTSEEHRMTYGITFFGDDEFCLESPPQEGYEEYGYIQEYYYRTIER